MKRYHKFLILIALLILLDQGTKFIIQHTVAFDGELMKVSNTVHIHPYINHENMEALETQAAENGASLPLLILRDILVKLGGAALLCPVLYAVISFASALFGGRFRGKWLAVCSACLLSAAVCNVICLLTRGGSLDFICYARDMQVPYGDHLHTLPHHTIWDIKDMYLWIGMGIACLLFLQLTGDLLKYLLRYCKLSKEARKAEDRAAKERAATWRKEFITRKQKEEHHES